MPTRGPLEADLKSESAHPGHEARNPPAPGAKYGGMGRFLERARRLFSSLSGGGISVRGDSAGTQETGQEATGPNDETARAVGPGPHDSAGDASGAGWIAPQRGVGPRSGAALEPAAGTTGSSESAAFAAPLSPERGFLLAVDDGGQLLVLGAARITFGHASSEDVDVGFLADLEPRVMAVEWRTSLRDGGTWWAFPLDGSLQLDGRPLGPEGASLERGMQLDLAHNLRLSVEVPDPASATILLELEGLTERSGARRIALFAEGQGGRLSIGPSRLRHVPVRGLELEIAMIREGDRVVVNAERSGSNPSASSFEHYRLPFPPRERVDLPLGRARGSRPPFALTILPAADAGVSARRRLPR